MVKRAASFMAPVGLLVVACLFGFSSPALAADERITGYKVDLSIGRDGVLNVRETISYDFGAARKHGIVRHVPRQAEDKNGRHRRYDLSGVRVSSPSGAPADLAITAAENTEIRIGTKAATVTGRHTYVIDYVVAAALTSGDGHDALSWSATGGWAAPISDAVVTVTLPVPVTGATCTVGGPESGERCRSAVPQGNGARFAHPSLDSGTSLAIEVRWRKGAIAVPPPVYEKRGAGALSLLALVIGPCLLFVPLLLIVRGLPRGRAGAVPAQTPPPGVLPGEVGVLLTIQPRVRDIAATLVDLADRGHLRVQKDGGHFLLVRTGSLDSPGLAPYEATLLKGLFSSGDEVSVRQSRLWFLSLQHRVRAQISEGALRHGWFRRDPVRQLKRQTTLGWVMFGATPLVFAGIVLSPGTLSDALYVSAFLLGAALSAVAVLRWVRPFTSSGSRTLAQVRGLRAYIESRAASDDAHAKTEPPPAELLPYAVAFGLAYAYGQAMATAGPPAWSDSESDTQSFVGEFVAVIEARYAPYGGGASSGTGDGASGGSGSSDGGGGGGGGSW